jgi:hypothetical protein
MFSGARPWVADQRPMSISKRQLDLNEKSPERGTLTGLPEALATPEDTDAPQPPDIGSGVTPNNRRCFYSFFLNAGMHVQIG